MLFRSLSLINTKNGAHTGSVMRYRNLIKSNLSWCDTPAVSQGAIGAQWLLDAKAGVLIPSLSCVPRYPDIPIKNRASSPSDKRMGSSRATCADGYGWSLLQRAGVPNSSGTARAMQSNLGRREALTTTGVCRQTTTASRGKFVQWHFKGRTSCSSVACVPVSALFR